MSAVYETAEASGLFATNDIKVRLQPYDHFLQGEGKSSFLHVFAHIMEGRSTAQKAELSKKIMMSLSALPMDPSFMSINITDFEKATYSNKALIHPDNLGQDRHFGL